MDDYFLAGAREDVGRLQSLIVREHGRLELEINGDKTTLITLRHEVDFLKYHISTTIKVKIETRDKISKIL